MYSMSGGSRSPDADPPQCTVKYWCPEPPPISWTVLHPRRAISLVAEGEVQNAVSSQFQIRDAVDGSSGSRPALENTSLDMSVKHVRFVCDLELRCLKSHIIIFNEISFLLPMHTHLLVPMDLDVKMKAVMIGACFLIVSCEILLHIYTRLNVILSLCVDIGCMCKLVKHLVSMSTESVLYNISVEES